MTVVVSIGERVPEFTLPDENGVPMTAPVSESLTVLVFYRGDW